MSKVSLNIVTWNSIRDLPDCLRSIEQQTYRQFSVLLIDNGSQDGVAEFLRANHPHIRFIQNSRNLGYARAHNQGIEISRSEYVVVMNPDVVLTPTFLEQLVDAIDERPALGSASGKLLRLGEGILPSVPPIIDSAGLAISRSRRVVNRGEGEPDRGQYDQMEEVFGFSGALCALRRAALRDVALTLPGRARAEYFDEDFFAYKEDIDLAWRMLLRGWHHLFVPQAVGYHRRQAQAASLDSDALVAKYRKKKSQVVNAYSYKNHLQVLLKNERWSTVFPDLPFIFFYELKKFLYVLLAERTTLKSILLFFRQLPRMIAKRRFIQRGVRVPARSIRPWFGSGRQ